MQGRQCVCMRVLEGRGECFLCIDVCNIWGGGKKSDSLKNCDSHLLRIILSKCGFFSLLATLTCHVSLQASVKHSCSMQCGCLLASQLQLTLALGQSPQLALAS